MRNDLARRDLLLLGDLSRFVRDHLEWFADAGRYLDEEYSAAAFRARRTAQLRETRASRGVRLEALSELRASQLPGEERRHVRRCSLPSAFRLGSYRRTFRGSDRYFLRRIQSGPAAGRVPSRAVARLQRALNDALRFAGPSVALVDAKALVLLVWLCFDPTAAEARPRICRFQELPWDLFSEFEGEICPGRAIMADALSPELNALAAHALTVLRLAVESAAKLVDRNATATAHHEPATTSSDYIFSRKSETWTICYAGGEISLRDLVGLGYIYRLIQAAGRAVSAIDLAGRVDSLGMDVLDEDARDDLARRLKALHERRVEVRAHGDADAEAEIDEEFAQVEGELRASRALGGRPRQVGSAAENARVAVGRSIATAIQAMKKRNPELAAHFAEAIKTPSGFAPRYEPAHPVPWIL